MNFLPNAVFPIVFTTIPVNIWRLILEKQWISHTQTNGEKKKNSFPLF